MASEAPITLELHGRSSTTRSTVDELRLALRALDTGRSPHQPEHTFSTLQPAVVRTRYLRPSVTS